MMADNYRPAEIPPSTRRRPLSPATAHTRLRAWLRRPDGAHLGDVFDAADTLRAVARAQRRTREGRR